VERRRCTKACRELIACLFKWLRRIVGWCQTCASRARMLRSVVRGLAFGATSNTPSTRQIPRTSLEHHGLSEVRNISQAQKHRLVHGVSMARTERKKSFVFCIVPESVNIRLLRADHRTDVSGADRSKGNTEEGRTAIPSVSCTLKFDT
jgi:hypothetical protein